MAKSKKNAMGMPVFLLVFIPFLAIFVSTVVLTRGVQSYLTTSQYFNVRELKVEGIADQRYIDLMKKEILGVNIFHINMSKLAARIRQRFPTFYSVTVQRVLPSELRIVAKERLPVAVVKQEVFYVLDAEGVVLMQLASENDVALPLIVGVEGRLPKIKLGADMRASVLQKSLVLARVLRSRVFPIRVVRIDASDAAHPFFCFESDVQVKVRDKDYEAQLDLLPSILRSLGTDMSAVSYVDLRPREPVIAMKDKKKDKKK